jgi:hypothetical protein
MATSTIIQKLYGADEALAAPSVEAMAGPDIRGAIAIALENEAGGTCDVWVITKFP